MCGFSSKVHIQCLSYQQLRAKFAFMNDQGFGMGRVGCCHDYSLLVPALHVDTVFKKLHVSMRGLKSP